MANIKLQWLQDPSQINVDKHNSLSTLLNYSMVQSPSWEANWFAASQEIPRIFMEPKGSLPHSQASATFEFCAIPPLEILTPLGDPSGGVVYLRIVLSPEEAPRPYECFITGGFLRRGVVSTSPNPQPGQPGHPF